MKTTEAHVKLSVSLISHNERKFSTENCIPIRTFIILNVKTVFPQYKTDNRIIDST